MMSREEEEGRVDEGCGKLSLGRKGKGGDHQLHR